MASTSRTPLDSALALAGFFLLCFAVGGFGAHSAAPFIHTWYRGLMKPSFTPSPRIFAPVWFVVYGTMAISAWMVWRTPRRRARSSSYQGMNDSKGSARLDALIVFYIQLFFNAFWVPLFFHYHRLLVSVVVILMLWIAIFFTILLFWRVRPPAGALLLPYLAVVSYSTALNLVLLHLN